MYFFLKKLSRFIRKQNKIVLFYLIYYVYIFKCLIIMYYLFECCFMFDHHIPKIIYLPIFLFYVLFSTLLYSTVSTYGCSLFIANSYLIGLQFKMLIPI